MSVLLQVCMESCRQNETTLDLFYLILIIVRLYIGVDMNEL